ncbi:MAG: phosphatase PAP2 family protein [Melioribacteraceae bacterium]|nr:phosphatase PAP2 family protein [Melioribacteraceae bacterium]
MFQTEINLFLQSFANDILVWFMKSLTSLGNKEFFLLFLISIITGINFRKGFLLIQILVYTGLFTELAKNYFALPRPWFVDNRLSGFGKNYLSEFTNMDAMTFWGSLPDLIIEKYRVIAQDSYGFPSGHTSSATVLWGSIMILFKNKWITSICIFMIFFIPVSRMFLARHFLADLAGGYLLGLVMFSIYYFVIYRKNKIKSYLDLKKLSIEKNINSILLILYLIGLPVLLITITPIKMLEAGGYLLGINSSYLIITRQSFPEYKTGIIEMVLRILVALFVFGVTASAGSILFDKIGLIDIRIILFVKGFLVTFPGLLISIYLIKKFNLITVHE